MCSTIYTSEGKEIENLREFREHFGFDPPVLPFYDALHLESCLCPADLEKAFDEKGIDYRKECMDYYLTEEMKTLKIPNGILHISESKAVCPHCSRHIPMGEIEEMKGEALRCKCRRKIGVSPTITGDWIAYEL